MLSGVRNRFSRCFERKKNKTIWDEPKSCVQTYRSTKYVGRRKGIADLGSLPHKEVYAKGESEWVDK